ncbi:MAG: amidohydrolase [Butyricicoccaceae bacterium]
MNRLALKNGKIYVERDVFAQAVLMENGRITAVGGNEDIAALAGDARVIDCGGRTVIPGLNDSHLHLIQIGTRLSRAEIAGSSSIDDMVQRVKAFMAAHPEACARGLAATGWNQDLFRDEKRMPNRYDLDRISTDIPIVLRRVCGHVATANSRALELLGMSQKPGRVEGGTIEVDENGVPNGIFTEAAAGLPDSVLPQADLKDARRDFLTGAQYALSHGITSVQSNDAGNSSYPRDAVIDMISTLYQENGCPLRYRFQISFDSPEDLQQFIDAGGYARSLGADPDMLAFGPVKLFKDGSLGGRTGTMRQGYLDDPGNFGVETTTDGDMDAFCRIADQNGLQVVTHVIGDKAIGDVTGNYERVLRDGQNPLRHALVHCQITDRPMLERIVRDHIPVMYQPIFLDYDMHAVISRCGEALSSTSYAFKTVEELGGWVSYGTDSPVEDCNPFPNIYSAVTRKDKNGWPEGGFFPEECVDVARAVDAYTLGSAYNEFRERDKGRIKPGFLADMVVLDTDIFTCDPMEIRNILPVMTIVGGRIAWEK